MSWSESGYKLVSFGSVALENVIKPAVEKAHTMLTDLNVGVSSAVNGAIDAVDEASGGRLAPITGHLKDFNEGLRDLVEMGISASHLLHTEGLEFLDESSSSFAAEMEAYFNECGIDIHSSWAFSSENREAIRQLGEMAKVMGEDISDMPSSQFWQYLIAWSILQSRAREHEWPFSYQRDQPIPELKDQFLDMCWVIHYAVGMYGLFWASIVSESRPEAVTEFQTDEQILARHVAIPEEDVIYSFFDTAKATPAHTICLDHQHQAIVLAVRGSTTIFDWMTDFNGEYAQYEFRCWETGEVECVGLVHTGILEAAQSILEKSKAAILSAWEQHEGYRLVITGHSLGGGLAGMLSLVMTGDPEIMGGGGFTSFPFATPPTMSENLSARLKSNTMSCICGNDVVTRLSLGAVKDIVSICTWFKSTDERSESDNTVTTAWKVIESEMGLGATIANEALQEMYHQIRAECIVAPKLCIPGHKVQIFAENMNKEFARFRGWQLGDYKVNVLTADYYNEVVFSRSMLSDHAPISTEKALLQLGSLIL